MTTLLHQVQQHAAALPLQLQAELLNYAIYLKSKAHEQHESISVQERQERLAAALTQAVALNPFADIIDPVAWQREQRQDRPLLGREYVD